MISNRFLIRSAQVISNLFSPFHLPVLVFTILMFFSYLNYMPWLYNLQIVAVVYLFTVLLPRLSIYIYRKVNGWDRKQLGIRKNRFIPYAMSILHNTILLYLMQNLKMPRFMLSVIICSLTIQGIGIVLNTWLKISMHAAACGGIIGMIMAFSLTLRFNPIFWLCVCIMVSGVVSSARLILRVHTHREVGVGFAIGVLCGFSCILFF